MVISLGNGIVIVHLVSVKVRPSWEHHAIVGLAEVVAVETDAFAWCQVLIVPLILEVRQRVHVIKCCVLSRFGISLVVLKAIHMGCHDVLDIIIVVCKPINASDDEWTFEDVLHRAVSGLAWTLHLILASSEEHRGDSIVERIVRRKRILIAVPESTYVLLTLSEFRCKLRSHAYHSLVGVIVLVWLELGSHTDLFHVGERLAGYIASSHDIYVRDLSFTSISSVLLEASRAVKLSGRSSLSDSSIHYVWCLHFGLLEEGWAVHGLILCS